MYPMRDYCRRSGLRKVYPFGFIAEANALSLPRGPALLLPATADAVGGGAALPSCAAADAVGGRLGHALLLLPAAKERAMKSSPSADGGGGGGNGNGDGGDGSGHAVCAIPRQPFGGGGGAADVGLGGSGGRAPIGSGAADAARSGGAVMEDKR